MTIEEMKKRKQELGLTNKMIADRTGIPVSTVQKIFAGATSAPRMETILALERVLRPEPDLSRIARTVRPEEPLYTAESAPVYKRQGTYTLEDYLALPDDKRYELIDGVLYDMASPTSVHQTIGGFIYHKMMDHVMRKGGSCLPLIAPLDVQLDMDDRTIVEPDVMVVCDRSKVTRKRVFGAPDMIIEVLSPSTARKDSFLKLHKYANAGVREYWLIDPDRKVVVQYYFEESEIPKIYGFSDSVPIRIWNDELRIDMKEVSEWIVRWISDAEISQD
ncbi:MAG: Uma2 family endonuclease [Lachnospiraceae bacterium]|nr:Uma2 family endonuclease [Lachnospiraceae bacterium]